MRRCFALILIITLCAFTACAQQGSEPTTIPTTTEAADLWDPLTYNYIPDINIIYEHNEGKRGVRTWCINFENDGHTLTGYVCIPETCLESRIPYSCIAYARGGTMYYGKQDPIEPASFAVGLDTVVITVEYRGKPGVTDGTDECGGAELYDFLKLIDFCEEFAFVDMDRLYMMGPSRGGMTTYQAIRVDERIKKAIVHSGVADMFLNMENRPDLRENYYKMIGGSPEEVPEEYEKRSAVYWADEFKCPVLFFHSKGDPRVSYAEAEKLVAALEAAGKEYKFVSYDDDVHGSHPEDWAIVREWCDFGPAGEE